MALISKSRNFHRACGFHYLNWMWSSEMYLLRILEDNVGVTYLISTLPSCVHRTWALLCGLSSR